MGRLALVILLCVGVAAAVPSPEQQALARVYAYRAAAGLGAVKLDRAMSKGCMEDARYMLQNRGTDAMAGLNAHTQRPELPGATPAGAACAKAADLFPGVSNLSVAIDGWMAGIYHRRPMMDPGLSVIGVGYAALPDGSLMAALMFGKASKTESWPVRSPAADQTDVPLEYGNEIPNPIPGNGKGGYPITLQVGAFDEVTGQGVNYVTGDYSRGASGFWVENGRIAYPVDEITIAGNMKTMLKDIQAVGADTYNYGAKTTGSVLIGKMKVAGN